MKIKIFILLISLFSIVESKAQSTFHFQASFQAFVEDSSMYACHYKDFWFIAHDCGLEVRYGNMVLEKYEFENDEDWRPSTGSPSAWYFIKGNDVYGYDTTARWAYIQTCRGIMQLYYEMPESFKFKVK